MSRRIRSLWQMVARDTAKRSPRSYPLRVERLEDRFVLSGGYLQTNLVSDIPHLAQHTDPNLHNPWGISVGPDGHVRVADNGTGLSTLYTEDGTALSQVVTIPPPAHSPSGTTAAPTGIVLNSTSDFVISAHHRSLPSSFIFATEDGTLSGWNPEINGSNAILTVDNSGSGAVYKGLALGSNAQGNFLFATNFHAGTIDVFDKHFNQVHLAGSFVDPALPPPPIGSPGFAPFGIQNVGGKLFVTYALQKPGQHDDLAGPGNGFVDVFDTTGHLVTRFASHGTLDSPWGMAVAPDDFGRFSQALLVGNFGDGRINAFSRATGAFLGQLSDPAGKPITIDGLWGLAFGKSGEENDANTLFFTAGINEEADGLFGTLRPAGSEAPGGGAAPGSSEKAVFVALLPPFAEAPSRAVQSPSAASADPISGTGEQTVLSSASRQMDAVSVGAVSTKVIDQAFGDFQPSLVNDLVVSSAI